MIRCIVAVICGILAGFVVNMAVVLLSWAIYRPAEDADMSNPETMKAHLDSLPLPGFLLSLVAHGGGTLVGGFVAALIARRSALVLGAIVGGFLLLRGVITLFSYHYPVWFVMVDVLLYVPFGILGAKLLPCRTSPATGPLAAT